VSYFFLACMRTYSNFVHVNMFKIMHLYKFNYYFITIVVPRTAGVSIIVHHNQIVGQLLTLECSVTTVRGITSRVEFIWSSSGTTLRRKEKLSRDFTAHYFDIYTDTYSIVPLSVNDAGRTYRCDVLFSARSPFAVDGNVTLDVIGKSILVCVHV